MNPEEYKTKLKEMKEKVLEEITEGINAHDVRKASDWLFVLDKLEKKLEG